MTTTREMILCVLKLSRVTEEVLIYTRLLRGLTRRMTDTYGHCVLILNKDVHYGQRFSHSSQWGAYEFLSPVIHCSNDI
jgi:hypothetical protein